MMTKFKGTPGPWFRINDLVYALDESGTCNRFSTRLQHGWRIRGKARLQGISVSVDEMTANACAIAAVPIMIEALENALADISAGLRQPHETAQHLRKVLTEVYGGSGQ